MKVITTPSRTLRKKARPIVSWTPLLSSQAKQMIKILQNSSDPEGVGLAAVQVGILKRFFIVIFSGQPIIFINPQITKQSRRLFSDKYKNPKKRWLEGCLSIPKTWGFVDRPYSTTLSYLTLQGASLKAVTQTFKDIQSAYVQHERDHLDGILFTDHILKQSGIIYKETPNGLAPLNP